MSLHYSDEVVTAQAKAAAKKKTRKFYVFGAAGAVLLTAGGAWAAMTLFGDGSLTAAAYEAKNLVVSEERLSKELYPVAEADLVFKVTNNNPFPVKINQIEATGAPKNVTAACDLSKVSGPVGGNPAYSIPESQQQTVLGEGGSAIVTIPKAVKLDLSATKGCGLTVGIKVTGVQTAAGNPAGGAAQPGGDGQPGKQN